MKYVRYRSLKGKFLGQHPSNKALFQWITSRWKVKGQMDLKLGTKYLYIVIFHYVKDRENGLDSNH